MFAKLSPGKFQEGNMIVRYKHIHYWSSCIRLSYYCTPGSTIVFKAWQTFNAYWNI